MSNKLIEYKYATLSKDQRKDEKIKYENMLLENDFVKNHKKY